MMRFSLFAAVALLAVAASMVSAQDVALAVTNCATGRQCLSADGGSCTTTKISTGSCHRVGSKYVIATLVPQQICVNTTQYVDAECTAIRASLSGGCTSCLGSGSSWQENLCGGLYGAMFLRSNCTSNACDQCNSARIPFKKCSSAAGLGSIMIHGEFACTQVKYEQYTDAGCTQLGSTSRYATDTCFEGMIIRQLN